MTRARHPLASTASARAAALCGALLALAMSCLGTMRLSAPVDSGELPLHHLAAAGSAPPARPV